MKTPLETVLITRAPSDNPWHSHVEEKEARRAQRVERAAQIQDAIQKVLPSFLSLEKDMNRWKISLGNAAVPNDYPRPAVIDIIANPTQIRFVYEWGFSQRNKIWRAVNFGKDGEKDTLDLEKVRKAINDLVIRYNERIARYTQVISAQDALYGKQRASLYELEKELKEKEIDFTEKDEKTGTAKIVFTPNLNGPFFKIDGNKPRLFPSLHSRDSIEVAPSLIPDFIQLFKRNYEEISLLRNLS